ncbi:MAG: L-threonylcarbamoyladenylate synthase, partial [Psychromonas sp.]
MSQFFYVHPENPQVRLIKQAVDILKAGGVIIYPTDSGYALGCTMDNKHGLEKICHIRDINKKHNFTLACRDLSEIATYARVDNQAFRALKNNTPGAYTFIFKSTKDLPKRLMNPSRRTIGIRIPDNVIALALLEALNEPLMTTSLILPGNESTEFDPEEIRDKLENQVDLILHGG